MPIAAGMRGLMKRNTITAPWSVNTRLYVAAPMIVRPGVNSSSRTSSANMPPMKNARITDARYMTPIRLWSRVTSHDFTPRAAIR